MCNILKSNFPEVNLINNNILISRFRHRYTKKSFEQLISDTGYTIYKPYLKNEEDRNKLWYIIVCSKE